MKKERIKYIDLLYSVYVSLKKEFKDATVSIKESGQEIKGPFFYVEVNPVNQNAFRFYDRELVNITITFTDEVLDQEKVLNMKADLNSIFNYGLVVNNQFIYFKDKQFSDGEDCINLTLTLDYFNQKDERNAYASDKFTEFMRVLHLDLKEGGNN